MNIVLPYCQKDSHMALEALSWMLELSGHIPTTCVLAHEEGVDATQHHAVAAKLFDAVRHHPVSTLADRWPHAANCYFAQVAEAMTSQTEPWYFMEPDNVPVAGDWFQQFQRAYYACGKPMMGAFFPTFYEVNGQIRQDDIHLCGSSVYPASFFATSTLCRFLIKAVRSDLARNLMPKAFDVYMQGETVRNAFKTHLIHHTWRSHNFRIGNGLEFDVIDPENKGLAEKLGIQTTVEPDCAVVHGCKDGSLLRIARDLHQQGKLAEVLAMARKPPQKLATPVSAVTLSQLQQSAPQTTFQPFVMPKRVVPQDEPQWAPMGGSPALPPDPREELIKARIEAGERLPEQQTPIPPPQSTPPASAVAAARNAFRTAAHANGCMSRVPSLRQDTQGFVLTCDCGLSIALPQGDWNALWNGSRAEAVQPQPEGGESACATKPNLVSPTPDSGTTLIESSKNTEVSEHGTENSKSVASNAAPESHPPVAAIIPHEIVEQVCDAILDPKPQGKQPEPQAPEVARILSVKAIIRKGELLDIGTGTRGAHGRLLRLAKKAGIADAHRRRREDLLNMIVEKEMGEEMWQ